MSAVCELTASKTAVGGTSSPAAKRRTRKEPLLMEWRRCAKREAVCPGPGEFFGQDVTMRSSLMFWDKAGVGIEARGAEASKVLREREVMVFVFLLVGFWEGGEG